MNDCIIVMSYTSPGDNKEISIYVYIGSGLGVCCLLLIIVGVVIGLIIAARKRSTSRRQFRYAPIAPAAV